MFNVKIITINGIHLGLAFDYLDINFTIYLIGKHKLYFNRSGTLVKMENGNALQVGRFEIAQCSVMNCMVI